MTDYNMPEPVHAGSLLANEDVYLARDVRDALEAQAEKHDIDTLTRLVRQIAEVDRLQDEIKVLKAKLADRAHPSTDPRDPPEVLRGLGFWPSCGCGECYAIHCLDEVLKRYE